jgi:leucyl-tRNA synthetase
MSSGDGENHETSEQAIPFGEIEQRWQQAWRAEHAHRVDLAAAKRPYYTHAMFPYPSGDKLHVGHVYNYAPADTYARFKRMTGYDVFSPMGFDAFGLPAENHAIKTGVHPSEQIRENIKTMVDQLGRLGCMYDWDKALTTSDPAFYHWSQWIFLVMHRRGLAYRRASLLNYCPSCQTVLANEQVNGGRCERCESQVVLEERMQWSLKITDYAKRLIDNLDSIDWPEDSKKKQRAWIGHSVGVNFRQKVKDLGMAFEVYDSIPQTYLAQTYTVIAPDRPEVFELVKGTEHEEPVMAFCRDVLDRKAKDPHVHDKAIEGIFTGRYVDDPFGTGDFPIWVASYAKGDYGTGWVNCSAHDERDFRFAKKYGIPLKTAMLPPRNPERAERVAHLEEFYGADKDKSGNYRNPDGIIQEPIELRGRRWDEVRGDVIQYIEAKGYGRQSEQYRLRDWGISRQRYWGTPIPIVYDPDGQPHPVPEEHLPWELPTDVQDFKPTGEAPLAKSKELIERTERIFGQGWRPEIDTMDTFVDSSFYSFRYLAEGDATQFVPPAIEKKWMPVATYVGGAEHATKHLIYARFVTMVLHDAGYVSVEEPYHRVRHQGLVQGEKEFHAFHEPGDPTALISVEHVTDIADPRNLEDEQLEKYGKLPDDVAMVGLKRDGNGVVFGRRVDKAEVDDTSKLPVLRERPEVVLDARSFKMSKSRGNAVSPDPVMSEWGVDTFRMLLMGLGPYEQSVELKLANIKGASRFLKRAWRYFGDEANTSAAKDDPKIERALHKAINGLSGDLADFKFNTAVSKMMELLNAIEPQPVTRQTAKQFVQLLAPLAPHMAEEFWRRKLGEEATVFDSGWPEFDESKLVEDTVTIPVQIDKRIRGKIIVARDAPEADVLAAARAEVAGFLDKLTVTNERLVPNRIVTFTTAQAAKAKKDAKAAG